jgi:hypothetical protein
MVFVCSFFLCFSKLITVRSFVHSQKNLQQKNKFLTKEDKNNNRSLHFICFLRDIFAALCAVSARGVSLSRHGGGAALARREDDHICNLHVRGPLCNVHDRIRNILGEQRVRCVDSKGK